MRAFLYLVLPLSVVSLTGCHMSDVTNIWNPGPVGRGYSSYEEPYKSPPGPEAHELGYNYSAGKNAEVLAQMRGVAADLVMKLEAATDRPSGGVYLSPPPARGYTSERGAFYNSFDHVLREELTARGYNVVTNPQGATALKFVAQPPKGDGVFLNPEKTHQGDLVLSLIMGSGPEPVRVSDLYNVPTYGYASHLGFTGTAEPAGGGHNQ
ncbi:MAG: hypothetical protein DHS20C02_15840 [Micavibrio sp.]|nr:MAG: hypothetical protein DHS20C02_15840 [Micavibrio sp.]